MFYSFSDVTNDSFGPNLMKNHIRNIFNQRTSTHGRSGRPSVSLLAQLTACFWRTCSGVSSWRLHLIWARGHLQDVTQCSHGSLRKPHYGCHAWGRVHETCPDTTLCPHCLRLAALNESNLAISVKSVGVQCFRKRCFISFETNSMKISTENVLV